MGLLDKFLDAFVIEFLGILLLIFGVNLFSDALSSLMPLTDIQKLILSLGVIAGAVFLQVKGILKRK